MVAMPQATAMDRGAQEQPVLTDQQIRQNVHQYKASMTDQPHRNNTRNTAEQAIAQYKTSSQNSSQTTASLSSGDSQMRQRQASAKEQQQAQGTSHKKRTKKKKRKQKKATAAEYCNMIPNMLSPTKYNQPNSDSPDSQASKKSDETYEYAGPQVQNQSDF